jgi:hypothetical protein
MIFLRLLFYFLYLIQHGTKIILVYSIKVRFCLRNSIAIVCYGDYQQTYVSYKKSVKSGKMYCIKIVYTVKYRTIKYKSNKQQYI